MSRIDQQVGNIWRSNIQAAEAMYDLFGIEDYHPYNSLTKIGEAFSKQINDFNKGKKLGERLRGLWYSTIKDAYVNFIYEVLANPTLDYTTKDKVLLNRVAICLNSSYMHPKTFVSHMERIMRSGFITAWEEKLVGEEECVELTINKQVPFFQNPQVVAFLQKKVTKKAIMA